VDSVREHESERQHTEANDDRGEDERLWNGIRKLIRARRCCRNERRLATHDAGGRQNQNVCPVRQQSEADDQLGQPAPEHQVYSGRIQHTSGDGQE
jgi:hypothetical protein